MVHDQYSMEAYIRHFVKSNYTNIIIKTSKFAHHLQGARFRDTKY